MSRAARRPGRGRRWAARLFFGAIALAPLLGLALDALFPFPFAALDRPAATRVHAAGGEPLRWFLPRDEIWRIPVRLEEVSPELVAAVLRSEDRRFWSHPGVDPLALLRAAWSNARAGRVVSGASTIPMQLARLAEPRERTLWAKAVEAFRAVQLVAHRPRAELLEHYLNLAPFGGNLEGVGAAAHFYFGKPPARLARGEIALLVALPRAPGAYDPTRHPERARAARDRVIAQLVAGGLWTPEAAREARRHALPTRRRAAPFDAPHFARFARAAAAGASRIDTEIDLGVQRGAERLARAHARRLRADGIDNLAVVVIEHGPRAVRAMVGAADFFDAEHSGQVNGALARRSPGSTLKPFLYGLALDRGAIGPDSFVLDIPTDFSGYVAENYDDRYRGRVSAGRALRDSLNAPAVALLARVGLGRFYRLLRRGGLDTPDPPAAHYGLPLVLGAAEVDLLSLTGLYASLADGGRVAPLRWRANPPADRAASAPWLSADAVAWLDNTLTRLDRPDLPASWRLTHAAPAVAWKTGTSYGHRDAWAVGYAERYAVGVWVGNPDGRGRRGLSGATHAAPLLFALFRMLGDANAPARAGPRTERVEVCAASHHRPGPFCAERVSVSAIRGVTRLPACREHRRVFVDTESGRRLAGGCLARHPHRARVAQVAPAALSAWWRSVGAPVEGLPPLHPDCRDTAAGDGPEIVSPSASTPYLRRADAPQGFQRLKLAARAAPGTARLFWYLDGALVGAHAPGETLFVPLEPGVHRVVVVDDGGRRASLRYRVEDGGTGRGPGG